MFEQEKCTSTVQPGDDSQIKVDSSNEEIEKTLHQNKSVELKKITKSSHGKKKKQVNLCASISETKYSLVRKVCADYGFQIDESSPCECLLIWSDSAVPLDKIASLKSYQKINHFPGMGEICRKDLLARNIWRIHRLCPNDFNFVPHSWILPGEYALFQFHARELKKRKRSKTYIRKPVNGAMGHGIWLTRDAEKIMPNETCIVQEYLDKPMLMDGFKFDLRMYAFVMSCDPLKVFLYKDGLVRMGTEKYVSPCNANVSKSFMHLTNYSINKHSETFVRSSGGEQGSKRTLKYFWKWLKEAGEDTEEMWKKLCDVVIKTLLVAEPHIFHAYHMCRAADPTGDSCCFEILGFDILIDRKYKPWVLEVNRAPSFGADQPLDYEIKYGLLSCALKLLNIKTVDKSRCVKAEKIQSHNRLMGSTACKQKTGNVSADKKKILQKRKKDLRWRLTQIRRESQRKHHEDQHAGNFVRIYPPANKYLLDYYEKLLAQCSKVVTGRTTLKKERCQFYNLKEEEILDLLQEVENDVLHIVDKDGKFILKGPTPLSSMPSSQKIVKVTRLSSSRISSRPASSYQPSRRPFSSRNGSLRSFSRNEIPLGLPPADKENVRKTLSGLMEMKIIFPGKSDDEAAALIKHILENWKFHRSRVATYWLVKLDAVKRKKVVDIVKGNVNAILQKTWQNQDMETNPLNRMFTKLFSRLLWNHGQGLWNCFNHNGNSWEAIFSGSLEKFSPDEMECCRQIVKLCRECLLVVYQFASEPRPLETPSEQRHETLQNSTALSRSFDHDNQRVPLQLSIGRIVGTKITVSHR